MMLPDRNYICSCIRCNNRFMGEKGSFVCKQCKREQSKEWESLSQEDQDRIIFEHEQALIEWNNNFQFPEDV